MLCGGNRGGGTGYWGCHGCLGARSYVAEIANELGYR